ncbi:FAD:protein FMN transferase [soil metagenome]
MHEVTGEVMGEVTNQKGAGARVADTRRVVVPAVSAMEAPPLGGVVHRLAGETMGTTWSASFVAPPRCALEPLQLGMQAALDAVVAEMSPWEHGSAISRFNRAAPCTWHALSPAFFAVLAHGLLLAEASGGACDPSVGALVDLWGFGPRRRGGERAFAVPAREDIARALACSGWQRLELDAPARRVRQPGGLRLDLSGIAKGFGVDEGARFLQRSGIESFLVEVGGELRGEGLKPDGQPWWVALEVPGAEVPQPVVALHGLSVATSGDYRRSFEHGGQRYSHTIDPRDGWPIRHGVASVTVLHRDCMAADALSTALTVMGVAAGLAFAREQGVAALFVSRTEAGFEEHTSDALAAMLA